MLHLFCFATAKYYNYTPKCQGHHVPRSIYTHALKVVSISAKTAQAATNKALALIAEWCIMNAMVLHPVKCEAMLLHRSVFIGPMQALTINNVVIKVVKSTRCLGIVIDNKLSWTPHLKETIKSFAKKLNLLKSLKFLPTNSLEQFYFKVILPSITYEILVWENCKQDPL